jgi:uncharacterized repeat protein (TIGR01451 family)
MAGFTAKWETALEDATALSFRRVSETSFNMSYKHLIMNTLTSPKIMISNSRFAGLCGAVVTLWLAPIAGSQAPSTAVDMASNPLEIKSIAEVESRSTVNGREVVKLIAADRVVPGDRVIYTLEVRNTGATALDAPTVTYPIPEHMHYVADSAVGPGAEVSYSVDGGHRFGRADNLKTPGADGKPRLAVAAEYTDIRWQLKNSLKADSVAFVRFRAVVK